MNAHELLIAARAMIPTPNDWTKGANARDANGELVDACDPNAVCYCAVGTVEAVDFWNGVNDEEHTSAARALKAAVPPICVGLEVHEYQDLPETTHADVLALFDRAIAATAPEAT